jgi:hypothetical protein
MRKFKKYSAREQAIIAWMIAVCCVQPGMAGTQGSYMNSRGDGVAVDAIKFVTSTGTVLTTTATSPYTLGSAGGPCARVNPSEAPSPGFSCPTTKSLVAGTPGKPYCQSRGLPNYVWSVQAYVSGGTTADNPVLVQKANIQATDCFSEIDVDTGYELINSQIAQLTVAGFATPGTALGLSGYYYSGTQSQPSLAELQANGELQFEYVLPGPFSFTAGDECTLLRIPVLVPDPDKFFLKVDTAALSIPFEIACPEAVVFGCGDPLVYPPEGVYVLSGGCGDPASFTVTYDPAEEELPIGVPTLVTATVTDGDPVRPNTATCTFMATRQALKFQGFFSPINCSGGSCSSPVYSAERGKVIPIKFKTTCNGSTYSSGQPPTFRVVKCATGQTVSAGQVKLVANEWHGNWDTTGFAKGNYILIVTLQDGTEKSVSIKLK